MADIHPSARIYVLTFMASAECGDAVVSEVLLQSCLFKSITLQIVLFIRAGARAVGSLA